MIDESYREIVEKLTSLCTQSEEETEVLREKVADLTLKLEAAYKKLDNEKEYYSSEMTRILEQADRSILKLQQEKEEWEQRYEFVEAQLEAETLKNSRLQKLVESYSSNHIPSEVAFELKELKNENARLKSEMVSLKNLSKRSSLSQVLDEPRKSFEMSRKTASLKQLLDIKEIQIDQIRRESKHKEEQVENFKEMLERKSLMDSLMISQHINRLKHLEDQIFEKESSLGLKTTLIQELSHEIEKLQKNNWFFEKVVCESFPMWSQGVVEAAWFILMDFRRVLALVAIVAFQFSQWAE